MVSYRLKYKTANFTFTMQEVSKNNINMTQNHLDSIIVFGRLDSASRQEQCRMDIR